jgi:hypothetical protein
MADVRAMLPAEPFRIEWAAWVVLAPVCPDVELDHRQLQPGSIIGKADAAVAVEYL